MQEPTMRDVARTLTTLGVEIGALRWSVVRLFSTLQKEGVLTELQISECLDPREVGQLPGQPEAILSRIAQTIVEIRAQIEMASKMQSGPLSNH
jgi:hypothetical protein